jgi:uncharacterized protein (DUF433 family)
MAEINVVCGQEDTVGVSRFPLMPQSTRHEWGTRLEWWVMGGPPAQIRLYSGFRLAYLADMDYSQIITMEPGKRSGKPCIRGTRITVVDVLEYLASGMTYAEILADFPQLTESDILACLAFAADRERKLETVGA